MKRIIYRLFCIAIILIIAFNIITAFPMNKKALKVLNNNDENMVMYTTGNGILNFPVVFGERLYLYDISKDKSILLDNTILPLGYIGYNYIKLESRIDLGWKYSDEPYEQFNEYKEDVLTEMLEKKVNEKFYGVKNNTDYPQIIEMTGDKEKVIYEDKKGYTICNFDIKGDMLYAIINGELEEQEESMIIAKNLKTGHITKKKCEVGMTGINIAEDEILLTNGYEGRVYKYNKKTSNIKLFANFNKGTNKESYFNKYYTEIRNGKLYCYNTDYDFFEIDTKSAKVKKIIKMSQDGFNDIITHNPVYYCKDYIAFECWTADKSEEKFNKRLLAYSYDGKLIRDKKLKNTVTK